MLFRISAASSASSNGSDVDLVATSGPCAMAKIGAVASVLRGQKVKEEVFYLTGEDVPDPPPFSMITVEGCGSTNVNANYTLI
ncbi:hypothetical protein ACHAWF_013976 [Thalassiosira exigua]